jgi:hypothetical protein
MVLFLDKYHPSNVILVEIFLLTLFKKRKNIPFTLRANKCAG